MKLDDIDRAAHVREQLIKVESAWRLLARESTHATVSVPSGSFDSVSGKNYCIEVALIGAATADLRHVLKYEYERMGAMLRQLGVEVPPLEGTSVKDSNHA